MNPPEAAVCFIMQSQLVVRMHKKKSGAFLYLDQRVNSKNKSVYLFSNYSCVLISNGVYLTTVYDEPMYDFSVCLWDN